MPQRRDCVTSASIMAACCGVHAIIMLPDCTTGRGTPVSCSKCRTFWTLSRASAVRVWSGWISLKSPAARGEACEPGSYCSAITTSRSPNCARCKAALNPSAPDPTTTAPALVFIPMTSSTLSLPRPFQQGVALHHIAAQPGQVRAVHAEGVLLGEAEEFHQRSIRQMHRAGAEVPAEPLQPVLVDVGVREEQQRAIYR